MLHCNLILSLAFAFSFASGPSVTAGGPDCLSGEKAGAAPALTGLDPVLLVAGEEKRGKKTLRVQHAGLTYWFSSPETRRAFESAPERYGVQLQGFCPVSPDLPGKSTIYLVHEGRIYLFFSEPCREKFRKNPKRFLPL